VQIRFPGWVQKVYADATYKQLRRGQPLLTIYSPELVTAEQDYLVAKELLAKTTVPGGAAGSHGSRALLDAATERLKQWQVPDREIARLRRALLRCDLGSEFALHRCGDRGDHQAGRKDDKRQ
jgi:hypothetical protein